MIGSFEGRKEGRNMHSTASNECMSHHAQPRNCLHSAQPTRVFARLLCGTSSRFPTLRLPFYIHANICHPIKHNTSFINKANPRIGSNRLHPIWCLSSRSCPAPRKTYQAGTICHISCCSINPRQAAHVQDAHPCILTWLYANILLELNAATSFVF